MTRPLQALAFVAAFAAAGCRRPSAVDAAVGDAGAAASASNNASPSVSPPPRLADTPPRPTRAGLAGPLVGEPPFSKAAEGEDEPALRPFMSKVRAHFKASPSPAPLAVQRASLLGGGAATLVQRPGEVDSLPLLIVEDRERKFLWEKTHPTVAMLTPVREPVIVGRSGGGVMLLAYDVPARVVAGRLLDADGTPFTDLVVLRSDDCQFVSAAYARRGTAVVCARIQGSRLQFVRHDATIALPREGVPVGVVSTLPAPISLAFDTEDTLFVFQVLARSSTKDGGAADARPHLIAFRYDFAGTPLFTEGRDLGEIARGAPWTRILAESLPGGARVTLPAKSAAERPRVVEIDSDGRVHEE